MSVHTHFGILRGTTEGIGGVFTQNIVTGTEHRNEIGDGAVYPSQAPIHNQEPRLSFSTRCVDNAIGILGIDGLAVTGENVITAYAQKHADGGTRAGATSHRSWLINEGIVVPRRLSVDHQGDAELSYDVIAIWDGTNAPIVETDGVSLPEVTFADDERWALGAVTLESFALPWLRRMEIDFGIEARVEGAEGNYWPTHVSIASIKPVLTLRGVDPTWLKAAGIPGTGKAATHDNTTAYLRKRGAGASWAAGSVHLKFTFAGEAFIETAMDSSAGGPAEATLIMPMTHDGTNNPVVVTQNQALP